MEAGRSDVLILLSLQYVCVCVVKMIKEEGKKKPSVAFGVFWSFVARNTHCQNLGHCMLEDRSQSIRGYKHLHAYTALKSITSSKADDMLNLQ